jgi:hypothetical protein
MEHYAVKALRAWECSFAPRPLYPAADTTEWSPCAVLEAETIGFLFLPGIKNPIVQPVVCHTD